MSASALYVTSMIVSRLFDAQAKQPLEESKLCLTRLGDLTWIRYQEGQSWSGGGYLQVVLQLEQQVARLA